MTPNHPNGEAPKGVSARPAELTESLRRFRADPPQDSLGAAADAGLGRAFVQAAVATAFLFAALTIGPFFLAKQRAADATAGPPPKIDADAAPADTPKPETVSTPATPAAPDTTAKKSADPSRPPAGVKGPDVLEKLGESGAKAASPKVNPLDKKEDDLLKDLK